MIDAIAAMEKNLLAMKELLASKSKDKASPANEDLSTAKDSDVVYGPDELGRVKFRATADKYPNHLIFAPWILKGVRRTERQVLGITFNCSCSEDGTKLVPMGPWVGRFNGNFAVICYDIIPATGAILASGQNWMPQAYLPMNPVSVAVRHLNFEDFIKEFNERMK